MSREYKLRNKKKASSEDQTREKEETNDVCHFNQLFERNLLHILFKVKRKAIS
jgi:hypothetical protein